MGDAFAAAGTSGSSVRRDGQALVFAGPLERAAVPTLWSAALPLLNGVETLDLKAVSHVDSAGLALLAELQARSSDDLTVRGRPDGLEGLLAAYRLDESLLPG